MFYNTNFSANFKSVAYKFAPIFIFAFNINCILFKPKAAKYMDKKPVPQPSSNIFLFLKSISNSSDCLNKYLANIIDLIIIMKLF